MPTMPKDRELTEQQKAFIEKCHEQSKTVSIPDQVNNRFLTMISKIPKRTMSLGICDIILKDNTNDSKDDDNVK